MLFESETRRSPRVTRLTSLTLREFMWKPAPLMTHRYFRYNILYFTRVSFCIDFQGTREKYDSLNKRLQFKHFFFRSANEPLEVWMLLIFRVGVCPIVWLKGIFFLMLLRKDNWRIFCVLFSATSYYWVNPYGVPCGNRHKAKTIATITNFM